MLRIATLLTKLSLQVTAGQRPSRDALPFVIEFLNFDEALRMVRPTLDTFTMWLLCSFALNTRSLFIHNLDYWGCQFFTCLIATQVLFHPAYFASLCSHATTSIATLLFS